MAQIKIQAVNVGRQAMPQKPGEFSIRGGRFVICCPCGCGDLIGIRWKETDNDRGMCWAWDGNEESPTVTPSIQVIGGCNWHGFLTKGQFITA